MLHPHLHYHRERSPCRSEPIDESINPNSCAAAILLAVAGDLLRPRSGRQFFIIDTRSGRVRDRVTGCSLLDQPANGYISRIRVRPVPFSLRLVAISLPNINHESFQGCPWLGILAAGEQHKDRNARDPPF